MKHGPSDQEGPFTFVTTSETEKGVLLIEVSSKLVNTQNYGHQGSILGGLSCNVGLIKHESPEYPF